MTATPYETLPVGLTVYVQGKRGTVVHSVMVKDQHNQPIALSTIRYTHKYVGRRYVPITPYEAPCNYSFIEY